VDEAGIDPSSRDRIIEGVPDITDPYWDTPTASSAGPNSVWKSNGVAADAYGWKHIDAGTYKDIEVAPSDHVMFGSGVYHITNSILIQGYAAGTSSLPMANNDDPPPGDPVSFVVYDNKEFTITSDAVVRFASASTFTDQYGNTKVANNLIIRSLNDHNAIKIVGQGNINLFGTIYAPLGDVELAGSSGGTVTGQVVAGRVSVLGGAGPVVVYESANVPATRFAILVE
ncbi:MAG: hypothetical protein ACYC1C_18275, partial [Chloroflexota bacterium]